MMNSQTQLEEKIAQTLTPKTKVVFGDSDSTSKIVQILAKDFLTAPIGDLTKQVHEITDLLDNHPLLGWRHFWMYYRVAIS